MQWDPFKPSIWKGQIITIVNPSNIFKVFWHQTFNSWECYTTNVTVADLSNMGILLLVNKIYTTGNKHRQICAGVNQVTLYPKEMTHMCLLLRVTWLVFSERFEWVKPCKFAVAVSIGQKTKRIKTKDRC